MQAAARGSACMDDWSREQCLMNVRFSTPGGSRLSHFGEGGRAALYRSGLVLATDGFHHGLHVRYGTGSPFVNRHQRRRSIQRVRSVTLVQRTGHLMHFVQTLAARLYVIVPSLFIRSL